ncbi:Uncharacterised protein [Collinsella aerofaciens]|nr:Uncharacterised protein [Collinsella aerofaciens]
MPHSRQMGETESQQPSPSPTLPRKFADVDWCSRKIKPNKICAECCPGAAFGPYWLLTERLRYETTLYYLLCAISCASMAGATLPMAAKAETMQPQETAEQRAQADATNSDTGKAKDGSNTNTTADTVGGSTATSTGTSAVNTESATGTPTTPGTPTATDTAAPSLRTQTNPTPEAISTTSQTGYAHSATAGQNGATFTVSWNDAPPAGTAMTFHVTQANGSSQ